MMTMWALMMLLSQWRVDSWMNSLLRYMKLNLDACFVICGTTFTESNSYIPD